MVGAARPTALPTGTPTAPASSNSARDDLVRPGGETTPVPLPGPGRCGPTGRHQRLPPVDQRQVRVPVGVDPARTSREPSLDRGSCQACRDVLPTYRDPGCHRTSGSTTRAAGRTMGQTGRVFVPMLSPAGAVRRIAAGRGRPGQPRWRSRKSDPGGGPTRPEPGPCSSERSGGRHCWAVDVDRGRPLEIGGQRRYAVRRPDAAVRRRRRANLGCSRAGPCSWSNGPAATGTAVGAAPRRWTHRASEPGAARAVGCWPFPGWPRP